MTYRFVYALRAVKDLEKLDPSVRQRIGKTLLRYEENPFAHSEKLINPKIGTYRFRIGEYRVIFDIEGEDVVVLRVGHRREIYRKV